MSYLDILEKQKIKLIYEDNHLLVCLKPEGMLSQKDITNDTDILEYLKNYLKIKYQKKGEAYLGLPHRLDRRVSGVMVFCKTSKASKRVCEDIKNHAVKKTYIAICKGIVDNFGHLENILEHNDKSSLAILDYELIKIFKLGNDIFSEVKVDLKTGRHNQIRKQFSMIGHPLINDFKFGYTGFNYNDHIGLFAYKIEINHPVTKEKMEFTYPSFHIIQDDYEKYFGGNNEKF